MAEVADHLLDGLFHAVELLEGRIQPDELVGPQAGEARVIVGVNHPWLRRWPAACARRRWRRPGESFADLEVFLDGEFFFAGALEAGGEGG